MAEEDKRDVPVEKAGSNINWQEKVRLDQKIAESNPYVFGLYLVVAGGLLAAGKFYLRFTLANQLFNRTTQDLAVFWVAGADIAFLGGLLALVVLPMVAYYQRHGLRQLGIAALVSFLLIAVTMTGFWTYLDSVPEPEPQPTIQGLSR